MEEKISKKYKDDGESILLKIIKDKIYEINLQGCEANDYSKKTIDSVLWADELSHNIIYKLFLIFQEENRYNPKFNRNKDIYSITCDLLYDELYSDLKKKKELNIEKTLEEKIKKLEKYIFLTSKGYGIEFKSVTDEYEEITFDEIKNMFLSLRKRKIDVYKAILTEFKKNKEKYLKYLME